MKTRKLVHRERFSAAPKDVFHLLHTPSAIRQWWDAARAIVVARPGGMWGAAWGESEDEPEYVTSAVIREFEPPRRLVLCDYRYVSIDGPLPFETDLVTEFQVQPEAGGTLLTVTQDGFPIGPEADAFYSGSEIGWEHTFDGIRAYLGRLAGRPE